MHGSSATPETASARAKQIVSTGQRSQLGFLRGGRGYGCEAVKAAAALGADFGVQTVAPSSMSA
jgi:hypothetical protein